MRVRPEAILALSLKWINAAVPEHRRQKEVTSGCFRTYFFLSPEVVSLVWEDLREVIEIHDDDFGGRCTIVHFLWTLYFYKTYNTWDHCAKFVGVCKQTYMEYVSKMTEFLQHIYDNEVSHFTFCFFSFMTGSVFSL